jgi:RimJ/RimL family protein N-acetyltransferase
VSWAELAGAGVTHVASPAESDRFGVGIARVTVGAAADPSTRAALLSDALDETSADVVVVRYPAVAGDCAAASAAAGRDVLAAGALVYWALAPAGRPAHVDHPDLAVVGADEAGAPASLDEAVDSVVRESFDGYANHYTFNPLLDDTAALAGYVDWARRATAPELSGSPVDTEVGTVVLVHREQPVGVATTSSGPESGGGRHVEVLLAGVARRWQGRGWYATLLAGVASRAFDAGASRLVISTQVHNTRVQRAWARAGFEPFAAVETLHLVRRGLLDT